MQFLIAASYVFPAFRKNKFLLLFLPMYHLQLSMKKKSIFM